MLRKLVCVGFHSCPGVGRAQSLWLIGGPGGGSRLLHPIHGRGVFQRSNIISNLIGSMRRMVAAGTKALAFWHFSKRPVNGAKAFHNISIRYSSFIIILP